VPPITFCMEDFNEKTNNLYVVRRRLAELTKRPHLSHFEYFIGKFTIKIHTDRIREHSNRGPEDRITHHDVLDVYLFENKRFAPNEERYDEQIDLEQDPRFKSYQPIKYSEWSGYSHGREMPIVQLCELVKYLHRLSNLSAFM